MIQLEENENITRMNQDLTLLREEKEKELEDLKNKHLQEEKKQKEELDKMTRGYNEDLKNISQSVNNLKMTEKFIVS